MSTVVPAGGFFDQREEMKERLRQGPGEENRLAVIATAEGSSPSRWTLRRSLGVLVSTISVMILLGFLGWTGITRLVRGEFLSLSERDFVLAARCLSAREKNIIFRHILPNVVGPWWSPPLSALPVLW